MSDFIVEKLTKSVGDKTVFKEISFIIHDLDRIGIIGVNGTGKTTLLDVVSERIGFDGDVSPFTKANGYKIAYLTQEPEFDDGKTVLDTVLSSDLREMALIREYETLVADYFEDNQSRLEKVMAEMDSLDAWSIESEVKTVLSKLGLSDLSQKVGDLSGGLRRRVQLAQVLLNDADLLLLDEPTNHLDIDTIAWLTNFLKSSKKTVLFITHDRYFLDSVATRIFELDQANLIEYQGNYQDYVRLKAEQDERDAAALHKKKQLYKQELAWMRTQPQARATKQQARINRFKELKGEVHQTLNNDDFEINFETSRIGKKVVNFEHVDFAYEDGKPILSDFNLIMQNRDRIGIVGDNGVGKSTLLNLINGDLVPTAGVLDIGETVRIGYFSQQIKDMDESKRVINYLQEVADEVKTTVGTTSITELLEQFLFSRSTHGTQIAKLSGGEKKRLYLLKILIEKPNVLLLDEPTNDLDIATLTVLENFINGFGGPVVTVSHDRYFLDKVANKILAFEEGGVREFFGNYTDYLDEKAFLQEQSALLEKEKEKEKEQARVKVEKVKEDKRRMSYFEKQEWATIEDEITDLEAKIEEIEAAMLENASDYGQLASLQRDLDTTNETLLEKYERYEYLSGLEG
ncbi:ATP-binding cassette domain-containing protein [Streptococcus thermophilus]|nr:ATP-binding cassette domain-containing protein [Streptococcus thermophilus]MCE2183827.1 ATP-binding cassette domain-containing protein [Streptococcus thermophilus]MCE2185427.1 ATP-binding cassette domain-containing protein [Streptococcus thermophilus]MCE2193550.1 ATP-binding cassette domain-containing protein [Streptococcus thermophilus]MCE2195280.1 ATP-binding cassette domain-containing protein [Streptococcus thermophilus]